MSKIKIFALGGLNENGKNMYVIEVDKDILVFEAGLRYADETMLGIDYLIPNIEYLKENKKRIRGIFLTHGHDENIGALTDLVKDLEGVNIYASKSNKNKKEMLLKASLFGSGDLTRTDDRPGMNRLL